MEANDETERGPEPGFLGQKFDGYTAPAPSFERLQAAAPLPEKRRRRGAALWLLLLVLIGGGAAWLGGNSKPSEALTAGTVAGDPAGGRGVHSQKAEGGSSGPSTDIPATHTASAKIVDPAGGQGALPQQAEGGSSHPVLDAYVPATGRVYTRPVPHRKRATHPNNLLTLGTAPSIPAGMGEGSSPPAEGSLNPTSTPAGQSSVASHAILQLEEATPTFYLDEEGLERTQPYALRPSAEVEDLAGPTESIAVSPVRRHRYLPLSWLVTAQGVMGQDYYRLGYFKQGVQRFQAQKAPVELSLSVAGQTGLNAWLDLGLRASFSRQKLSYSLGRFLFSDQYPALLIPDGTGGYTVTDPRLGWERIVPTSTRTLYQTSLHALADVHPRNRRIGLRLGAGAGYATGLDLYPTLQTEAYLRLARIGNAAIELQGGWQVLSTPTLQLGPGLRVRRQSSSLLGVSVRF